MFSLVLLYLQSLAAFLSECQEWSTAPISAFMRRGPRGCFCNEFCTGEEGGGAIAVPRVKLWFLSTKRGTREEPVPRREEPVVQRNQYRGFRRES